MYYAAGRLEGRGGRGEGREREGKTREREGRCGGILSFPFAFWQCPWLMAMWFRNRGLAALFFLNSHKHNKNISPAYAAGIAGRLQCALWQISVPVPVTITPYKMIPFAILKIHIRHACKRKRSQGGSTPDLEVNSLTL